MKYLSFTFLFLLFACESEPENPTPEINWTKENSTELSKQIALQEEIDIQLFLEMRSDWDVQKTGSGLRYYIYENGDGESPKPGEIAEIEYSVKLLDGTECYSTEADEYEELRVDKSTIETGVQEGIKLMKVGDRAKLIIPSHIGHGLLGDMDKIPPLNTIIVDIHLLGIK